jgi:probable HAF family extracellular repeat protein
MSTRKHARHRVLTITAVLVVMVVASGCLVSQPAAVFRTAAVANDVNGAGLVVGSMWPRDPPSPFVDIAYRYDSSTGTLTPLGTMGRGESIANGINDDGFVVGQAGEAAPDAFLYDPGTGGMEDLGTLGGTAAVANDINADRVVVGWSLTAGSAQHAFSWDPDTEAMEDLGTLGGSRSVATAVNDAGLVVGWSDVEGDGARHAFVWDPETGEMDDLGTLGGTNSAAEDVNDTGTIVGWSEVVGAFDPCVDFGFTCPPTRGFVYDLTSGAMTQLGIRPGMTHSFANGINEAGAIVGYAENKGPTCSHCPFPRRAMGWEVGSTGRYDLNGATSGDWAARAVNDTGLVVGVHRAIAPFSIIDEAYTQRVHQVDDAP